MLPTVTPFIAAPKLVVDAFHDTPKSDDTNTELVGLEATKYVFVEELS